MKGTLTPLFRWVVLLGAAGASSAGEIILPVEIRVAYQSTSGACSARRLIQPDSAVEVVCAFGATTNPGVVALPGQTDVPVQSSNRPVPTSNAASGSSKPGQGVEGGQWEASNLKVVSASIASAVVTGTAGQVGTAFVARQRAYTSTGREYEVVTMSW